VVKAWDLHLADLKKLKLLKQNWCSYSNSFKKRVSLDESNIWEQVLRVKSSNLGGISNEMLF